MDQEVVPRWNLDVESWDMFQLETQVPTVRAHCALNDPTLLNSED